MKLSKKRIINTIIALILIFSSFANASEDVPTEDEVTKLYVATFNRAPDYVGLDYWVNDSKLTLSQIAKSFFDQEETQRLYPTNISNEEFTVSIYQNLFNRKPDTDGWMYWVNELNKNKIDRNQFILAVINGAKDNEIGNDATTLNNKKLVGLYFAKAKINNIDDSKLIMQKVKQDTTTLTQIYKDIDNKNFSEDVVEDTTEDKEIVDNSVQTMQTTPSDDENNTPLSWYKPTTEQTWNWQLSGDINQNVDAMIYDIDLYDTTKETIQELQASGKKVMCYFSAGSWENFREDKDEFPTDAIGKVLDGWEDEKWLDIRDTKVKNLMINRIRDAREKGCDGVEADNVDGYTNDTGFNLTYQDQLSFNRFLADQAHKNSLFIALKNDLNQVNDLITDFDLSVNEQCFEYDECEKLSPFIDANKPVFNAEYDEKYLDEYNMTKLCNKSNNLNFKTLILPLNLDNSFRYSCDTYLFEHHGVGFGGSNTFKFHDNVWVNSADLVLGNLDTDYYKSITNYDLDAFNNLSSYLKKSKYVVFWITKGWQESWFSIDKIQSLMDAGYTPVFNYWYFGDKLMDGLDADLTDYYDDVRRVKQLLASLDGTKMLIMEPEFNKENILASPDKFIEVMRTAMDIVDDKQTLISLCMTDTGNRSSTQTYQKCGYENCSLGDKYEWARPEAIYNTLLNRLDFISFQEMVGQFSRNPSNAGSWDEPNPIAYTDEDIGIDNLAKRIDNFAAYLKEKYNKPVFLPYITIATASWSDDNNNSIIETDEINATGWEDKALSVYKDLNSTNLFGYATMSLFDDPSHDEGGYQYFMQNEYHLGIIKSEILEGQPTGEISQKSNILEQIFR